MDIGQDMLNNSALAKHLFRFDTLKAKVMSNELFLCLPHPNTTIDMNTQKGGGGEIFTITFC